MLFTWGPSKRIGGGGGGGSPEGGGTWGTVSDGLRCAKDGQKES